MRGRRLRAVFRGASLRSGRATVRHGNPIRTGAGLVHAFGRARGAPLATQDWNNRKVGLGPARARPARRGRLHPRIALGENSRMLDRFAR